MAITVDCIALFHDTIRDNPPINRYICDLGNQVFWGRRMMEYLRQRNYREGVSARKYFTDLGLDYTSIDMNGLDGSLMIDLREALSNEALIGKFGIVMNYGTTEHVGVDTERSGWSEINIRHQEVCFDNIDRLTSDGGLMIHFVPYQNVVPHGLEYSGVFFRKIAEKYGYSMVSSKELTQVGEDWEYSVAKLGLVVLKKYI